LPVDEVLWPWICLENCFETEFKIGFFHVKFNSVSKRADFNVLWLLFPLDDFFLKWRKFRNGQNFTCRVFVSFLFDNLFQLFCFT
jgi:hypothetical protein